MARIIAFAGASRVGKTTLMNAVAEKIRKHGAGDLVQVYSSEVGAWYAELGVDASANTDFDTRLRLQEAIADRYIAKVHSFEPSKAGVPSSDQLLFMDRSWADLCAYTLADVPRDITPEQDETVQRIISKLTALAPYQACCFVRPGIPLAPPQQEKKV
jgi:thymidylate kinase